MSIIAYKLISPKEEFRSLFLSLHPIQVHQKIMTFTATLLTHLVDPLSAIKLPLTKAHQTLFQFS